MVDNYTISAMADVVTNETGILDNTYINGIVTVRLPIHDIATTNVLPASNIVPREFNLNISVTVENQGDFAEAFNLIVYANTTIVEQQKVFFASGESTVLAFTWNTMGVSLGDYIISAKATIVPGKTETSDNTYIDGRVTVKLSIHDVAVIDITPSKTVIGTGLNMSINVTVENEGDFTETFNITLSINQTKTVTLPSGSQTTLTFTWNTTGVPYGNYTISAYVEPVPDEINITNNMFSDGLVFVTIPGDVDGDRDIDIFDSHRSGAL
ncbi:MAG: CARDB domain-containing protein [Candidatus Bathyarchaeia archaeon]